MVYLPLRCVCRGGGGGGGERVRLSSNLVADFSNFDRLHSVSNQQMSVESKIFQY